MPAKQKVTLYIPDDLHRQFKVRSAVDGLTMSSIAQRALEFYLKHSDVVESSNETSAETVGRAHLVHACPKCNASVALKNGSLSLLQSHPEECFDNLTSLERISNLSSDPLSPDEGELVSC